MISLRPVPVASGPTVRLILLAVDGESESVYTHWVRGFGPGIAARVDRLDGRPDAVPVGDIQPPMVPTAVVIVGSALSRWLDHVETETRPDHVFVLDDGASVPASGRRFAVPATILAAGCGVTLPEPRLARWRGITTATASVRLPRVAQHDLVAPHSPVPMILAETFRVPTGRPGTGYVPYGSSSGQG